MSSEIEKIVTGATPQLQQIINIYTKFLPAWTYPYVGMFIAGSVVFLAWFGGRLFFPNSSLLIRILGLWSIAFVEYAVLIPTIGASVEVLHMSESTLAVLIHAVQLVMFMVLNKFTLKAPFTMKHAIAFALMIAAVFIAAL